jgi:hypothetical protein
VRAAGSGLGGIVALWATGWPGHPADAGWVGLGGAIVGLILCLGTEYVLNLNNEVKRLHSLERELEAERSQMSMERTLRDHQVVLAQREATVSSVWTEIWGGAFNEAVSTGHILPLSAILARAEVTLQAKNLDKPLPESKL